MESFENQSNSGMGDVILVERITEVRQRRGEVGASSKLNSVLILSSVNLPLGEPRSQSAEDERAKPGFLQKGDLISAEGQAVFSDESSLCTRGV